MPFTTREPRYEEVPGWAICLDPGICEVLTDRKGLRDGRHVCEVLHTALKRVHWEQLDTNGELASVVVRKATFRVSVWPDGVRDVFMRLAADDVQRLLGVDNRSVGHAMRAVAVAFGALDPGAVCTVDQVVIRVKAEEAPVLATVPDDVIYVPYAVTEEPGEQ